MVEYRGMFVNILVYWDTEKSVGVVLCVCVCVCSGSSKLSATIFIGTGPNLDTFISEIIEVL